MQGYKVKEKTAIVPVGKPHTDSVPPTMQSQIPKSRDVTLFFFRHDALHKSNGLNTHDQMLCASQTAVWTGCDKTY